MSDSIEERLDALEQREQRLDAIEESIEEITKQLTAHNNRMDALSRMANSNKDYVDDAQRSGDDRIEELERAVEHITDTLTLLEDVQKNTISRRQKRIAQCLITLQNQAERGRSNASSLDANGIMVALGGAIDRTVTYDMMSYIEEAVDKPEVCYKETHGRSSAKNTRVVVNLDAGDLPKTYAGIAISAPTSAPSYDD